MLKAEMKKMTIISNSHLMYGLGLHLSDVFMLPIVKKANMSVFTRFRQRKHFFFSNGAFCSFSLVVSGDVEKHVRGLKMNHHPFGDSGLNDDLI